jgi:hypothetical protein
MNSTLFSWVLDRVPLSNCSALLTGGGAGGRSPLGAHVVNTTSVDFVLSSPAPSPRFLWSVDGGPYAWALDVTAPVLRPNNTFVPTTKSTAHAIRFTASEVLAAVLFRVDGSAWTELESGDLPPGLSGSGLQYTHQLLASDDGLHVVEIKGVDLAGNVQLNPSVAHWVLDRTAPTVELLGRDVLTPVVALNSSLELRIRRSEATVYE